ncbi:MAG: hypothetical protein QM734_09920 [Cyclobacteriaceae bacterium]
MSTKTFKLVLLAISTSVLISSCSKKATPAVTASPEEKSRLEQEAAVRTRKEIALKKREEALKKVDLESDRKNAPSKEAHIHKLSQYFDAITCSTSFTLADNRITETLKMFESAATPVLMVVNEEDGRKDYGKPTTIISYLIYLKQEKKNVNMINDLKIDCSGKITEVELVKN